MEIDVTNIEEHDDGSATLIVDMDEEALMFFVKYGIRQALLNNLQEDSK